MKTIKKYKIKADRIDSLEALEHEKIRLRMEILKKEESIKYNYRHLVDALTFRNLTSTIISDLSTTSTVVSKAFSFGKSFFDKRKKKKRERHAAEDEKVSTS